MRKNVGIKSVKGKQKGYTLFETVVYVGLLSVLILAVFTVLFSITKAFVGARIYREVEVSGIAAMDRMAREIRGASSVDTGNSILDVNPGELQIDSTDEFGASKIVNFYYDEANHSVNIIDGGVDKGPLTGSEVEITNLVFRQWNNLVKIEMTVQSKKRPATQGKFYDSIVMRGSY